VAVTLAILRALSRVIRRDLATFQSVKVNNFFLFVALLIGGALASGVKPASAYPFLLLLGFLLLFPLSSDPLAKIPPGRLASWPIGAGQRFALRLASLALSPILWLTVLLLLKTSASLALYFLGVAIAAQGCVVLANRVAQRAPRWNPGRHVPQLPGRLGGLIRKNVRQMLSVLDSYVAVLLSISGSVWRFLTPYPDPDAFLILALLVALALSTCAQCLFGLDSAAGATRYGILPLRGWQVLLAKGIAFLGILLVLVLPLSLWPGMTFGLAALAVGNISSVFVRIPQQRWRFTSGRLAFGVAQVLAGTALGLAEYRWGARFLLFTAAAYLLSVYCCGRGLR
jgi:hypothetical protein